MRCITARSVRGGDGCGCVHATAGQHPGPAHGLQRLPICRFTECAGAMHTGWLPWLVSCPSGAAAQPWLFCDMGMGWCKGGST